MGIQIGLLHTFSWKTPAGPSDISATLYGILFQCPKYCRPGRNKTTMSKTALGPTQPPIQWVPGALSLGVNRPGREAHHSHPPSAWRYITLLPPCIFMAWDLVKQRDNLTLLLPLNGTASNFLIMAHMYTGGSWILFCV
jgi:hypothetical protein